MYDIIGKSKRKFFFLLSAALVLASMMSLIIFGLKPGIDFTGGTLIDVRFDGIQPELSEMQFTLDSLGWGNVVIQPTDANGYLLKLRFLSEPEHRDLLQKIKETYEKDSVIVREESIQTIGPSISEQLRERAFTVTIATILAIGLYIAYAFRKVSRPVRSWKYGMAAILALAHDVLITLGAFAILGKLFEIEVDIPFVVAVLTIAGYSVNDTIVVFDRTRENLIKYSGERFETIVNRGLNETLVRSLNTSLATLLVSLALFFFGGGTIHYFSLALIVGIVSGTYSSIFVASALLVAWNEWGHRDRS